MFSFIEGEKPGSSLATVGGGHRAAVFEMLVKQNGSIPKFIPCLWDFNHGNMMKCGWCIVGIVALLTF